MTIQEKLALIENCMDLEEGALTPDKNLSDFEEWDSLTALSIIVMVSEQFHKTLSGNDIKKARKVSDLLAFME